MAPAQHRLSAWPCTLLLVAHLLQSARSTLSCVRVSSFLAFEGGGLREAFSPWLALPAAVLPRPVLPLRTHPPCSSRTPRVHEHDETTVQPVRDEAPGPPARVLDCTPSKSHASSCVRMSPPPRASAGATRHARSTRVLPSPRADCVQGVPLPTTSLSLRGASHGESGSELRRLWQRRVAAKNAWIDAHKIANLLRGSMRAQSSYITNGVSFLHTREFY